MNHKHLILPLLILLNVILVQATEISVLVVGPNNQPLKGITVYAYDGKNVSNGLTDFSGKAFLNVETIIDLKILAADMSNRYSIEPYLVNTSQAVYKIQMTNPFPVNREQTASMIDKVITAFNKYLDFSTLSDISAGISSGKVSLGSTTAMLGIPGIFSISPIPTVDQKGRTVFEVSGVLARPLYNFGNCVSGLGCEYRVRTM